MGETVPSGAGPPHFRGFTITDTSHLVLLLWTSDQSGAETCIWQYTTLTRDRYPFRPGRIWTHNPSKRAVADPHLRLRGHWDRQEI